MGAHEAGIRRPSVSASRWPPGTGTGSRLRSGDRDCEVGVLWDLMAGLAKRDRVAAVPLACLPDEQVGKRKIIVRLQIRDRR